MARNPFPSSLMRLREQLTARAITRVALALLACAWLAGALLFLRADGSLTWTLPALEAPPAGEHNLTLHRFGPTLRASSYFRDPYSHHHPAFLVDGHPAPSLVEKWASALGDLRPWVELSWREPRTLSHVVIRHAGWREEPALTARNYRLRCLADAPEPATLKVTHNGEAVAVHALACPRARGLRITWRLARADELARVYEIEAWGR